jgi:hypothetical protein
VGLDLLKVLKVAGRIDMVHPEIHDLRLAHVCWARVLDACFVRSAPCLAGAGCLMGSDARRMLHHFYYKCECNPLGVRRSIDWGIMLV